MKLTKHTSLEESEDVQDTLRWKLDSIQAGGLPIEEGLADYIGLAVGNIEARQAYIKNAIKELRNEVNRLAGQITSIKQGAATFLIEQGIERLNGVYVSSITVTGEKTKETPAGDKTTYHVVATKEEVKDVLLAMGMAEMRTTPTDPETVVTPATIRVNKRRIAIPDVVEAGEG